ncbi:hypothetical protein TWF506_005678 [Arthrobotrys conoides]|uniref:Uncharacterized protein n=1 Tax=Arthrobotrys conoides TaxID=74498 RepID=A0AAN8NEM1_9PEZI
MFNVLGEALVQRTSISSPTFFTITITITIAISIAPSLFVSIQCTRGHKVLPTKPCPRMLLGDIFDRASKALKDTLPIHLYDVFDVTATTLPVIAPLYLLSSDHDT